MAAASRAAADHLLTSDLSDLYERVVVPKAGIWQLLEPSDVRRLDDAIAADRLDPRPPSSPATLDVVRGYVRRRCARLMANRENEAGPGTSGAKKLSPWEQMARRDEDSIYSVEAVLTVLATSPSCGPLPGTTLLLLPDYQSRTLLTAAHAALDASWNATYPRPTHPTLRELADWCWSLAARFEAYDAPLAVLLVSPSGWPRSWSEAVRVAGAAHIDGSTTHPDAGSRPKQLQAIWAMLSLEPAVYADWGLARVRWAIYNRLAARYVAELAEEGISLGGYNARLEWPVLDLEAATLAILEAVPVLRPPLYPPATRPAPMPVLPPTLPWTPGLGEAVGSGAGAPGAVVPLTTPAAPAMLIVPALRTSAPAGSPSGHANMGWATRGRIGLVVVAICLAVGMVWVVYS